LNFYPLYFFLLCELVEGDRGSPQAPSPILIETATAVTFTTGSYTDSDSFAVT